MARISEYVRTLPGVARRSIERVLADPSVTDSGVTIRTSDSIDVSDLSALSIVTPSKLNMLWSSVSQKNVDAWSTVGEVDNYIRAIGERCDAVVSSTARMIGKNEAILDGIFMSAGRHESIDSMYVETFSGTENTDMNLTTARIESGRLVLAPIGTNVLNGSWKVRAVHPASATVRIDEKTGAITAGCKYPVGAAPNETLMVTIAYELSAPAMVTTVVVGASGVSVSSVRITNSAGQVTKVDVSQRIETTRSLTVNFPRTSVTSVEVDIVQKHFTIDTYTKTVTTLPMDHIVKKLSSLATLGSALNVTGHVGSGALADRVRAISRTLPNKLPKRLRHMINSKKLITPVIRDRRRRSLVMSEASFSIVSPAVNVYDMRRKPTGTWVSTPIVVNGDAKSVSLSVDQFDDNDVNTTWSLSVEGHPWVAIVPENARVVTGEMLDLDFSLTGQLDYPANDQSDIKVHGIPDDTIVTTIKNKSGHITALQFSKTNGGPVTIDYTTAFSGIVDLEEIGQTTGGVRVIDATTDGSLGEHFSEVNGSITLKNQPHGRADIYVDGVLATQIPDDTWFTDPSLSSDGSIVYCKLVGKTVFVKDSVSNVSAYYKYAQTSIRIKADLESSTAEQGRTPMIDSVTVGVKTMSV